MRLWVSKNSEVPLREQLATQILLAIVSGDFEPGEKLPSTRELALRLRIHSNTVSAVFRDLERRGWLEVRKGSGVYVRAERTAKLGGSLELEQLIADFLRTARSRGFSLGEIQRCLKHHLELQPPDRFLLIEPDVELRLILEAEIRDATGFPVSSCGLAECSDPRLLAGAAPVCLFHLKQQVREVLTAGTDCLLLHSTSVPAALKGRSIPPESLIAIVSRWPEFRSWSRTLLVAAGASPDALFVCDPRERGWERRLRAATAVITDLLHAHRIPRGPRLYLFRLVAETSLDELRKFVNFLGTKISI